jgi:hypothetical protein
MCGKVIVEDLLAVREQSGNNRALVKVAIIWIDDTPFRQWYITR